MEIKKVLRSKIPAGWGRNLTSTEAKELRISRNCVVVQCCGSSSTGLVYRPMRDGSLNNTGIVVSTM